jgi:flagellar FliL protein
MLLAVIGLTVVLIGGGVGGYFVFRHKPTKHKAAPTPAEETASDSDSSSASSTDSEPSSDEGSDSGDAKKKKLPAQYMDMQPSFVVNLEDADSMRYLQVDVQLMTRDPKAVEEIKTNMPRIRNTLMLLFSQQHAKDLNSRESKENLQKQALDQVRAVMREETGSPSVEALYFTGFVMQ